MSFKDYKIDISYKSLGENTISDIVNPLLKETKIYKRSVGFFSTSAFDFISEGIVKLSQNNGCIQLLTSPNLSSEDINAISLGYETREILKRSFEVEFENALKGLDDKNLRLVAELIANDTLNVKIVCEKNGKGMYHDKLAILYDFSNNRVVFTGSNNESRNGYGVNYEKVRVFKSWQDEERVNDEEEEFDSIWKEKNDHLTTYEFMDALKDSIIKVQSERISTSIKKEPYDLFPYQKEAINSWKKNGYNGFYIMATGTGKTVTALYSLKELQKVEYVFTIIAVPYKHLVSQWYDDVRDIFDDALIFKVSGEIINWEKPIKDALFYNYPVQKKPIIVISTISSFYSDRFEKVAKLIKYKKMLIVDEAHNFLNKIYKNQYDLSYEFKLGLSATPVFGKDVSKTKDLLNYFGGTVFELPIEKAIGKYLVNYHYTPIFVEATEEDENKFNYYTKLLMSCFDAKGRLINGEKFTKAYRNRLRTISMAENKIKIVGDTIDLLSTEDHFIIYCSDGKVNDDNGDIKHLNKVVNILNTKGYKPSQFTASETMEDRIRLIHNFNEGYISTLVAIRCLDEGINIPSIKVALILSSNDNYREFVQRRGRILRKYKNKKDAHIYDLVVLPSIESKQMATIELRRFHEYAKLALNKNDLVIKLEELMDYYDITYNEINFDNDYIDGGDLDD